MGLLLSEPAISLDALIRQHCRQHSLSPEQLRAAIVALGAVANDMQLGRVGMHLVVESLDLAADECDGVSDYELTAEDIAHDFAEMVAKDARCAA